MEDSSSRAKARIVQSPERIRKTISIMSTSTIEDKRTVAMHEAKARDLQAKINALHNIETVGIYWIAEQHITHRVSTGCPRLYRADSDNRTRSRISRSVTESTRSASRPTRC